ncbi:DUF6356 family protein [Glacieibacterium frigidum]|uniref:Capsule biosynthesis protein n=1 Tax=Glacieibacterium frigidum TaxID=2593303 RepID=A0A552UIR5_9SPHN|nr:DUF6356 family protein [Glacieibacterium frigidum]TRW18105.1 hypothetical protein FMM06_08355 [Glacieibacterium frigidum]
MFARLFIEHPRTVGEGYFEHMAASLGTARKLAVASLACVVHAVVPGLCKTTGSTAILKLHAEVAPRRFDQPTL